MDLINVVLNGSALAVPRGTALSELIAGHADLDMPCSGRGSCGKCRITALGDLSPMSERELSFLSDEEISRGVRLACMTRAMGDCTVRTDASRPETIALSGKQVSTDTLGAMFEKYGVAIDVGTTTIAAALYAKEGGVLGRAGVRNPQRALGADVVSRIEASMGGQGETLAGIVCNAIEELVLSLARQSGVDPLLIDGAVIVGNTAMLSLATKTDVSPLSRAPFIPKRLFGEYLCPDELGFSSFDKNMKIYIPPCISGYIGADTVSALLASGIAERSSVELLCDVGTNGEIALSYNGKLCCASTAAGPAFEGAGISMGSTAVKGAISSVRIVNGALMPEVIGGGRAESVCGSGIIDALACLLALGELDESGYIEDDALPIGDGVSITRADVRAIQLAKSAIHAGMRTLIAAVGLDASEVERLLIAGGFGSFINVSNASAIGMIPSALKDRVEVLGNAALEGAGMMLCDVAQIEKCSEIIKRAQVVELSANPLFTDEYMKRMFFEES